MSFIRNASILGFTQILNLVLTLASRIVLSRLLGPASYGAFGAASNAMSVSSRVLSLGTASASQYYSSKTTVPRGAVVGTSLGLALMVGVLSLAGTLALLKPFESWFFSAHPSGMQAVMLMAWSMPLIVIAMNLGVMLIPFGNVRAYSTLQLIAGSAFIIPCLILVRFLPPLQAAAWAQMVVWFSVFVGTFWFLRHDFKDLRWSTPLAGQLMKFGLASWPNVCLNIGIASFSTLFGARYLTPEQLSIFVLAMNIVDGLFGPHVAMGQLVLSKSAGEEHQAQPKIMQLLRVSMGLFLGLFAMIAALGGVAIPLIFGSGFAESYPICLALFVTGASHALLKTMANAFAGAGRPGLTTWALGIEVLSLVAFLSLWGPSGLWGVVGSSVTAATLGWIIAVVQMCRLYCIKPVELLIPSSSDWVSLRTRLRGSKAKTTAKAA